MYTITIMNKACQLMRFENQSPPKLCNRSSFAIFGTCHGVDVSHQILPNRDIWFIIRVIRSLFWGFGRDIQLVTSRVLTWPLSWGAGLTRESAFAIDIGFISPRKFVVRRFSAITQWRGEALCWSINCKCGIKIKSNFRALIKGQYTFAAALVPPYPMAPT